LFFSLDLKDKRMNVVPITKSERYKITKDVAQCILISWASLVNRNNSAFYLIRRVEIAMDL